MRTALIPALLLVALCSGPAGAQKARSEALDLDDKDRALVAKEGVKQSREQKRNAAAGKSGNNGQCGSVDIGNDSGNKKGSQQVAERQKTVIVTGNIINTANCK